MAVSKSSPPPAVVGPEQSCTQTNARQPQWAEAAL